MSDQNSITIGELSMSELTSLQYQLAEAIRVRRVKGVLGALVKYRKDYVVSGKIAAFEQQLAQELNGAKRQVFIDEYLDLLELLLDVEYDQ